MKKVFLAFSHFDTGGLQTFMLRIATWCKKNKIDCHLIFESSDEYMESCVKESSFHYLKNYSENEIKKYIKKNIVANDEILWITFELPEFLYFEHIKSAYFKKYNIKHLIYNVSVGGMIYGRNFRGKVGKLIYNFYRSLVLKYAQNNQVLFMDRDTLNAAQKYYNYNMGEEKERIFLLPMEVNPEPQYGMSYDSKTILTVSRADFPFKGYLFSLIDVFENIACSNFDVNLVIVSFGPDYKKIQKKIELLPIELKKRAKLINGLHKEGISELLKNSYVYIGMGTTILDAANEGIPAIVVCHHTMDCVSTGLFSDDPEVIGKIGDGKPVQAILEKILSLRREEYMVYCKNSYLALKKFYSIDDFMKGVFALKQVHNIKLKESEWIFQKTLFGIRDIRRWIFNIK